MLGDVEDTKYAALVADWGLAYYDSETTIVTGLRANLTETNEEPEPQ